MRRWGAATLVSALLWAGTAFGQSTFGSIVSPILTIDSERVFLESAFGRRVAQQIEEDGAVLAAENRRIEAELAEEEERLTKLRPSMEPAEFRKIANDFDVKVQAIRKEQVAKNRVLSQRLNTQRAAFRTAARPVLEALMLESEAAVILERRSVILSANAIDITEDAIRRLDETLADQE